MKKTDMPDNNDEFSMNVEGKGCRGLTCIGKCIHCPATRISGGSSNDELEDIAIEHLLNTLAQVALSIAARELPEKDEQERDS